MKKSIKQPAQKTPGTLFIIAAPSGGGKTSLVKRLLQEDPQLAWSISHTTRFMRPQEQNGVDYFFISTERFADKIAQQDFLEHAMVFGYHYGTSSEQVLQALQTGIDVILEIDWQGAQQVRQLFDNVVSIFILPPNYDILAERLASRGQDSESIIQNRMKKSRDEMSHCHEFDFIVFNEIFETCLRDMQSIIASHRLSYSQQCWRNADKLLKLFS